MSGVVRRWIVRGEVQGVGFRWFVRRQATALGLAGFAQNRADGSVEVVAQGDAGALAELEGHLGRGPRFSRVSTVDSVEVPHHVDIPKSFETR